LQGGLAQESFAEQPLLAPSSSEALAKVPQEVPGGLVGIGGLGGEVTATAEVAGPASSVKVFPEALGTPKSGYAVTIPLKVKLSNELLGENCYIGSDAEPIVLHLTDGKTKPPEGVEPIEGSAVDGSYVVFEVGGHGDILKAPNLKLVDNTFAVPGASGCGSSLEETVVDEAVDLDIGLPAKAGASKVIMSGLVEQTSAADAAKYLPKPKKEKKKK
jgi:hypothetical protein